MRKGRAPRGKTIASPAYALSLLVEDKKGKPIHNQYQVFDADARIPPTPRIGDKMLFQFGGPTINTTVYESTLEYMMLGAGSLQCVVHIRAREIQ